MIKLNLLKVKINILCAAKNGNTQKSELNAKNILTNNEINELGYNLIKQHLKKPLSFHLDNLKINKIPFKIFKIKNLLRKKKL